MPWMRARATVCLSSVAVVRGFARAFARAAPAPQKTACEKILSPLPSERVCASYFGEPGRFCALKLTLSIWLQTCLLALSSTELLAARVSRGRTTV